MEGPILDIKMSLNKGRQYPKLCFIKLLPRGDSFYPIIDFLKLVKIGQNSRVLIDINKWYLVFLGYYINCVYFTIRGLIEASRILKYNYM